MSFRVAIVGCGYFSRFHRDAWRRAPDVQVIGICDADRGKAEAGAAEMADAEVFVDLERMLDTVRPDLLDIVTPPATHRAIVAAAGRRKVDVVCQKPVADDLAPRSGEIDGADQECHRRPLTSSRTR